MRIISKTYVLLAIIIGVSLINLAVLLQTSQENKDVLHSISSASNLKVSVARIAGTANSIASGNDTDRQTLVQQIADFENTYNVLGSGGQLNGITISWVRIRMTFKLTIEVFDLEYIFLNIAIALGISFEIILIFGLTWVFSTSKLM